MLSAAVVIGALRVKLKAGGIVHSKIYTGYCSTTLHIHAVTEKHTNFHHIDTSTY